MNTTQKIIPSRPYSNTNRRGDVSPWWEDTKGFLMIANKKATVKMIDKKSLTTLEMLLQYCSKRYHHPVSSGSEWLFECPFGNHSRPKLSVGEKNGHGVWHCWACDLSGDIFNLYALEHDLTLPQQFREAVEGVADVLGLPLGKKSFTQQSQEAAKGWVRSRCLPSALERKVEPPVFLSAENEKVVWGCATRLQESTFERERLARELGLSPETLLERACRPELGSLGLTPDFRLLYIYSQCGDDGILHITGCKVRRRDGHGNTCLKLIDGQWESYGTMNPNPGNADGIRFMFPTGRAYSPWGYASLRNRRAIIITEGESDALAMSECLHAYRRQFGGQSRDADGLPAVMAIGGANGFRKEWPHLFKGLVVILAFDADEAGRKASDRVQESLRLFAVVRTWSPPPPFKDARDMLTHLGGIRVIESVLTSIGKKEECHESR